MYGADLGAHALAVVHGAGAALVVATVLYLAGLAMVPRDSPLASGETPAILAGAVFVLVCWFGVERHVPLAWLALGFTGAALAVALARIRWMVGAVGARVGRPTARWALAFLGFYVLIYLFLTPPVTQEFLPIRWMGNIDVMTYLRFTQHVLLARPWNAAGQASEYLDYVYRETPAVFYFDGGLSLFFGQEALPAAMPVLFASVSWLGIMVTRIARSVFGLPRATALAVGALLIASPFYRYIVAEYFLSTLMALPVVLYLVWTTVTSRPKRMIDVPVAVRYGAAYVLLLFLYSALLLVGIAAQIAVVALLAIAEATDTGRAADAASVPATAGMRAATLALPLLSLVVLLSGRVSWAIGELALLSRHNIAGWSLTLISPFALLGVPGTASDHVQCLDCLDAGSKAGTLPVLALAGFVLIAAGLVAVFWRGRGRLSAPERTLAAMAAGAMLAYSAFFLLTGPSYQQWKFASYTVMPWSFVVAAVVARLARGSTRLVGRSVAVVFAAMIAGNLVAHAQAEPPMSELPGDLRNLAALDADRSFGEITVRMRELNDAFSTWMALYFLPSKRVHVVSRLFDPNEPLSYESVTRQRPLLLDGVGCEGIGHSDAREVPGVGCLTFGPPSLALDASYPFNQSYVFIELTDFGGREPEGRWSLGEKAGLTLRANIERVDLFADVYVNVRVTPYLPPGTSRQRFAAAWGKDRHGETALDKPGVISLRVGRDDWTGTRVWTLPITLTLPDAVPPPWMYTPRGKPGAPPLAAVFEELSVTRTPLGEHVVSPRP